MNSRHYDKRYAKYILIGIQAFILLAVISGWLLRRGNTYGRSFMPDEYILSETATVSDIISIDASSDAGGIFLSTPPLSLKKGTYLISIDYSADTVGSSISADSGLGAMEMHCPPVELDPACPTRTMTLEIARATNDVTIHVSFSGTGQLSISSIGIYETSYLSKKNLFYAILFCLFLNAGYFFLRSDIRIRKIMLALSGIFLVSCYPLYTDFLTVGHDLPFHLIRIDAISQGLSSGTFPVKLHPLWANGYGYAVGIFYGDIFLYFPAVLRLLGFSIQTSYKFFLAAVNLGTILLSYYSFRKMFSDDKTGLLGCLAYSLAPYRLMDLYTRSSVGEYCALMVLPLVLYGFYRMLYGNSKENWWKPAILTAFGLTGIIQSHVLSSLLVCFVILLTCLLLVRRVFRPYVFRSLAFAAVLTLMLNLNFIVPFLDFYREDLMINSSEWTGSLIGSFQAGGLFPIQLFALFQRSSGGAWPTTAGISTEPTFGIGILMTIGLFLFLYLFSIYHKTCKDNRNYGASMLCMLLGCLLLYMSTCYFPWDAITSIDSGVESVVHSLEFPWRMLTPAMPLLTFVLCYCFDVAGKAMAHYRSHLIVGSLLLLFLNCGWYFYDFCFSQEPYRIYDTSELYTMQMYSYDYLPYGTDPHAIRENLIYTEGVAPLDAYQKQGTNISCNVTATGQDAYIDFPLLYYKYYRCTDLNTSQRLPVCAGTNNMVRVLLPQDYSGSIQVGFAEPWFWRLAEVLSALTFIGTLLALLPFRKRLGINFRIVQKK